MRKTNTLNGFVFEVHRTNMNRGRFLGWWFGTIDFCVNDIQDKWIEMFLTSKILVWIRSAATALRSFFFMLFSIMRILLWAFFKSELITSCTLSKKFSTELFRIWWWLRLFRGLWERPVNLGIVGKSVPTGTLSDRFLAIYI